MKRMLDAVIYDMDGLLLDSERAYVLAWEEVAVRKDIPLTREIIRGMIGMNFNSGREYMHRVMGEDFPYERLLDDVRQCCFERLEREHIPLKPYAEESLSILKDAGFHLALATGTKEDTARSFMGRRGLLPYFEVLTFGGETKRGKPDPDVFLLTADKLKAAPDTCVVLEDSANGILAGKAAGMTALWIPDLIRPEERPDIRDRADCVFENLKEAALWLRNKGEKND